MKNVQKVINILKLQNKILYVNNNAVINQSVKEMNFNVNNNVNNNIFNK